MSIPNIRSSLFIRNFYSWDFRKIPKSWGYFHDFYHFGIGKFYKRWDTKMIFQRFKIFQNEPWGYQPNWGQNILLFRLRIPRGASGWGIERAAVVQRWKFRHDSYENFWIDVSRSCEHHACPGPVLQLWRNTNNSFYHGLATKYLFQI